MRFLTVFIIGAVTSEMYFMWFGSMLARTHADSLTSYGDALVYCFRGMKEIKLSQDMVRNVFEIPVGYLLIGIMIALIIGGHVVKDIRGYGKNKIIRYQSRLIWWIKACAWNVLSVVKYYLSLHAGILSVCMIHYDLMDFSGKYSLFTIHESTAKAICSAYAEESIDTGMLLLMIIVLPFMTIMAVSLLQMMLEFILMPAVSFMLIIALYISSAFYMRWYMIGNYLMVYRMQPINANGITLGTGIAVAVTVAVISVFCGYLRFKDYDII